MHKFIVGSLLKPTQLYIYIKSLNLILVLFVLKNNSIILCQSLLDLVVVDYLDKGKERFELNYVFLNYVFENRLIIKTYTNGFMPMLSIGMLYQSSL